MVAGIVAACLPRMKERPSIQQHILDPQHHTMGSQPADRMADNGTSTLWSHTMAQECGTRNEIMVVQTHLSSLSSAFTTP